MAMAYLRVVEAVERHHSLYASHHQAILTGSHIVEEKESGVRMYSEKKGAGGLGC